MSNPWREHLHVLKEIEKKQPKKLTPRDAFVAFKLLGVGERKNETRRTVWLLFAMNDVSNSSFSEHASLEMLLEFGNSGNCIAPVSPFIAGDDVWIVGIGPIVRSASNLSLSIVWFMIYCWKLNFFGYFNYTKTILFLF